MLTNLISLLLQNNEAELLKVNPITYRLLFLKSYIYTKIKEHIRTKDNPDYKEPLFEDFISELKIVKDGYYNVDETEIYLKGFNPINLYKFIRLFDVNNKYEIKQITVNPDILELVLADKFLFFNIKQDNNRFLFNEIEIIPLTFISHKDVLIKFNDYLI
jgi:hypothetical protein